MSLIGQLKMYYKGSFLSQTLLWVEVSLPNWVRSIIYFDDLTKKPKRKVSSPHIGQPWKARCKDTKILYYKDINMRGSMHAEMCRT